MFNMSQGKDKLNSNDALSLDRMFSIIDSSSCDFFLDSFSKESKKSVISVYV